LHRFAQHFPGCIQIRAQPRRVGAQLAKPALQRIQRNQTVREAGAERAQHGGIGQVALPAADRQLFRKVAEQGIGDPEVALGIFEIDRVHLVRHGAGTHFAGAHRLSEVTQRDIAPDIAAQIDQHGIGATLRIAQFGNAVVRFDLGGVRVPVQAQRLDETLCKGVPVHFGIRHHMGVVIADRAVDLARDGDLAHLRQLPGQTMQHVGQFLAQCGW